MCKRLLDRNAVVTGAARGMGFAIAKALYQEGARVAILDIDEKGAAGAANQLDGKNGRAIGRRVDVTRKSEITQLVQEMSKLWGGVDILVNNAGGGLNTPYLLDQIEEKDWNLVVDVNLKGTFLCCQTVIPEMIKRGGLPGRGSIHGGQGRGGRVDPPAGLRLGKGGDPGQCRGADRNHDRRQNSNHVERKK